MYIRVVILGALSRHSSIYRGFALLFISILPFYVLQNIEMRITAAEPRSRQLMYDLYIRVAVSAALSCSEQKPSLRQRHRLQASNAESRIRLVVLLTAPKIFAISSITDKNSCRNFARLSAWWFDWVGHPRPKFNDDFVFRQMSLYKKNIVQMYDIFVVETRGFVGSEPWTLP